jgi:hypothetical protein
MRLPWRSCMRSKKTCKKPGVSAVNREVGKLLKGQTKKIPDIYYMDKSGLLKLLWEKTRGTNK